MPRYHLTKRVEEMPANVRRIVTERCLQPFQIADKASRVRFRETRERHCRPPANCPLLILKEIYQLSQPARMIHNRPDNLRCAQIRQGDDILFAAS